MGSVVVLASARDAEPGEGPRRPARALLALARRLGEPVAAWCGPVAGEQARALARCGAARIVSLPAAEPGGYAGVAEAEALVAVARRVRPSAVLIPAGRAGHEIAARVAVRLDAGVITDAVDVEAGPDGLVALQEAYQGSYLVGSGVRRGIPVITVRTEMIDTDVLVADADAPPGGPGRAARGVPPIECMQVKSSSAAYGARVISRTPRPRGARPDLTAAPVVVAGGRGVGSAGAFALLDRVAAAFGGAVGGSQAAADQGWCAARDRIDQTGASVRPLLYLACGISGSVRHRAGMQHSRTIVAIDRDPAAPIFRIADFGVVGELEQVLPALLLEIARRRGIRVDDLTEA